MASTEKGRPCAAQARIGCRVPLFMSSVRRSLTYAEMLQAYPPPPSLDAHFEPIFGDQSRTKAIEQIKMVAGPGLEPTRGPSHSWRMSDPLHARRGIGRSTRIVGAPRALIRPVGRGRRLVVRSRVQGNNVTKSPPITRQYARSVGEFLVSLPFARLRSNLRNSLI